MSKVPTKVYGYAVIDKDGNLAPLNRKVYDTPNAAANGFSQATKKYHFWGWKDYPEITPGMKLKDQSTFRVIGLVAE